MYYGPESEAREALKILDDFVNGSDLYGYVQEYGKEENYSTWMDWHGPQTDAVGGSSFLVSRLI